MTFPFQYLKKHTNCTDNIDEMSFKVQETHTKGVITMSTSSKKSARRKAVTPEGRINQLVALAFDLAEQQLRDGSATSQVITTFLKYADPREQLEREILAENKKLVQARTAAIENSAKTEELYANAIAAMKSYQPKQETSDDDEYER